MWSKAVRVWIVGLRVAAALLASALPAQAQLPPEEGFPILVVEAYSTTPSPVRSGQNFTLSLTVKNTGTKHADDIFASVAGGSSFVGLGAPAAVGKLDPGFSNTVTLEIRAPAALNSGAVDLPLQFLYRIGESGAYEVVRNVGLVVSGGGAAGKPQVVVEEARVLTTPEVVGDTFEVALTLRNVGARRADDVSAALQLNETLSPAEGSGTTRVGDLAQNEAATITLTLVLDRPSASGRVLQTIRLEYTGANNERLTSDETVGLDLGAVSGRRPQLIVADYATEPARPAPGQQFVLTVRISNVGAGDARRILTRLGDETGLPPFAPLGSGNVRFVPSLPAGESVAVTQTLLVDGSAQGGAYPLHFALTYENAAGESQTETEIISLLVVAPPHLRINLTGPIVEPLIVGEAFEIPIEIINIGRQIVNVSTVEITSDALALTDASLYIGPLDAGTSGSLVALATADEAGTATATVVVRYLDDFNQEQTVTQTLSFRIEAADAQSGAAETEASEPSFLERLWQIILGVFGLGG